MVSVWGQGVISVTKVYSSTSLYSDGTQRLGMLGHMYTFKQVKECEVCLNMVLTVSGVERLTPPEIHI